MESNQSNRDLRPCACQSTNECDHDPGKCPRLAIPSYKSPNGGGGNIRFICNHCLIFERKAENSSDFM